MYTKIDTIMQIMIAQSLQFLFLASLSKVLALFFMVKAESLMLLDLLSIS